MNTPDDYCDNTDAYVFLRQLFFPPGDPIADIDAGLDDIFDRVEGETCP